jgi:hypothetical protein
VLPSRVTTDEEDVDNMGSRAMRSVVRLSTQESFDNGGSEVSALSVGFVVACAAVVAIVLVGIARRSRRVSSFFRN